MSEATIPVQAAARPKLSEDLVAVSLGLGVFVLGLLSLSGADALGWLVTTSVSIQSGLGVGGLVDHQANGGPTLAKKSHEMTNPTDTRRNGGS
jgi:hypothetical protein